MKAELFTACDFAADYGGKLTIVGVFDTLGATHTPVVHPQLCIVAKIRFDDIEAGRRQVRFTLTDFDGQDVLKPLDMPITAPAAPAAEAVGSVVNLVLNINGVTFSRFGEHSLDLSIDGVHIASTPLYLRRTATPPPA